MTALAQGGPDLPDDDAALLAERHGLRPVGRRPSLPEYVRDVWRHRHLMWAMAKGEMTSQHQDNYLGMLWSIITPLLLGLTYFLVFGLLLNTRRGIDNFVIFLMIGIFSFSLLSTALAAGGKSLNSRRALMRAMHFPRVLIPITTVVGAFVQQLPAFLVLLLIAVVQGEPVRASWLLYPVSLIIVTAIGLGIAMLLAPLIHSVRDLGNLLPVAVGFLRYMSGVFFSIGGQMSRFEDASPVLQVVLEYQPFAVAMTIVRETLMAENDLRWDTWLVAAGWAVVFSVGGFILFWRGEGRYGRE